MVEYDADIESKLATASPPLGYQPVTSAQRQQLIAQGNSASDWQRVVVNAETDCSLIHYCNFYGTVWIDKLTRGFLRHKVLQLPIGLYHLNVTDAFSVPMLLFITSAIFAGLTLKVK